MNAADPEMIESKTRGRKSVVMAIDSGQTGFADVLTALQQFPNLIVSTVDQDGAPKAVRATPPDVLVLDFGGFTATDNEFLVNLRTIVPDVPMIVLTDALDDMQVRRLMKLRVHDWLRKPLVKGDFLNAIHTGVRSFKQASNRVHAILSANGGAGATTVSVMLADILASRIERTRGGVGLFDLDFSSGACGYLLNLERRVGLEGVLGNPGRIDAEFVSLIQQRHAKGFAIYSYKERDIVTHLNCYELVLRLLDAVTSQHMHTILDLPYYETDWRQDVLAAVNTITIVCELNLPSIKQTLEQVRQLETSPGRTARMHVLINKRKRGLLGGQRIPDARIRQLFGSVPYSYLPEDGEKLSEAMDRGVPLSDLNSSSRFHKALMTFASKVILPEEVKA